MNPTVYYTFSRQYDLRKNWFLKWIEESCSFKNFITLFSQIFVRLNLWLKCQFTKATTPSEADVADLLAETRPLFHLSGWTPGNWIRPPIRRNLLPPRWSKIPHAFWLYVDTLPQNLKGTSSFCRTYSPLLRMNYVLWTINVSNEDDLIKNIP